VESLAGIVLEPKEIAPASTREVNILLITFLLKGFYY
jgi:hypothetical protein